MGRSSGSAPPNARSGPGRVAPCGCGPAASGPLHCLIVRGPQATIVRRWSADTRLNGQAFTDAPLRPGDRLSVGAIELEVLARLRPTRAIPTSPAGNWPRCRPSWTPAKRRSPTNNRGLPAVSKSGKSGAASWKGSSRRWKKTAIAGKPSRRILKKTAIAGKPSGRILKKSAAAGKPSGRKWKKTAAAGRPSRRKRRRKSPPSRSKTRPGRPSWRPASMPWPTGSSSGRPSARSPNGSSASRANNWPRCRPSWTPAKRRSPKNNRSLPAGSRNWKSGKASWKRSGSRWTKTAAAGKPSRRKRRRKSPPRAQQDAARQADLEARERALADRQQQWQAEREGSQRQLDEAGPRASRPPGRVADG